MCSTFRKFARQGHLVGTVTGPSGREVPPAPRMEAVNPNRTAPGTRGARSFDHLVGEGEQLLGYSETERLGGRQVDDQIELGRLLDWNVAGLGSA